MDDYKNTAGNGDQGGEGTMRKKTVHVREWARDWASCGDLV